MGANPVDEHFGARIRMRRTMLRLSQRTLAGALGISLERVRQYESGEGQISVVQLCEIADALDVKPEFLFAGVPRRRTKIEKSPMIDFLDSSPNATEDYTLVRTYMRIKDAKMKWLIIAIVEAIAGD